MSHAEREAFSIVTWDLKNWWARSWAMSGLYSFLHPTVSGRTRSPMCQSDACIM